MNVFPLPVKNYLIEKGCDAEHVTETDLSGTKNGKLYLLATQRYQVLVTNDRHFRHALIFPATDSMGIVYLRVTPNHSQYFIQAIENFGSDSVCPTPSCRHVSGRHLSLDAWRGRAQIPTKTLSG